MANCVTRDRNLLLQVQNPAENRKITQLLRMRLAASEAPQLPHLIAIKQILIGNNDLK